jgi:putative MATE family efflux protein
VARPGNIDTTEGGLFESSLKLAWPAVLQAILVNFYAFNDFFFVGLLGDEKATAALSACFALLIVKYTVVRILPTGGTTLVAQFTGARRTDEAAATFRAAFATGIIWATFVGLAGIVAIEPIVELNNVTPEVGTRIRDYLVVLLASAPAFALMFVVDGTFRARGNTRMPLVLEVVSLVVNTFLNWVLVLGNLGAPEMGIMGAAIATAVSRALPGVIGIVMIFRGDLDFEARAPVLDWFPSLPRLRRMFRIGFFDSLGGVLYGAIYLMLNRMAGEIGTAAQGGLGAGLRGIEWIAFAFGDGFMRAAVTIVGQNIGAGKVRRARRGAWLTAALSAVSCQVVGIAFLVFPEQLCGLVTDDPATLGFATEYVYIMGWAMWAVGFEMACYGALLGAGRSEITLMVSGVVNILRIPIAAWFLFGLDGVIQGTLWAFFGFGTPPTVAGAFSGLAYTIAITAAIKATIYFIYVKTRTEL